MGTAAAPSRNVLQRVAHPPQRVAAAPGALVAVVLRRVGRLWDTHCSLPTETLPLDTRARSAKPWTALFQKFPKLETAIYFGFWCVAADGRPAPGQPGRWFWVRGELALVSPCTPL
jgi:hypothetical protein